MASPFSLFRKHERLLMAGVVLMAMIAFVFMDPLFGIRSGGTKGQDPVAVETALYGDIHESDLQRMLASRALANRFAQQTIASLYGFMQDGFFGADSENAVVETMLLARKAEQMGIHVTDEEITRFLQELSSDRLTAEQFAQILQGISGRRSGLSRRQLYDALRTELLAKRLTDGLVGSSQAPWEGFAATLQATPAERWESYQRLNNRAVIEAVPVAVADFLDKVPDPDDTAVRTLYERYKEYEPIPGAPVPGFKIPAKIALQYFTADYERFEELVAVTDQEIHDEYEKNKNTRYLKRPDFDTGSQEPAAGGEQPPTPGLDDAQPQGDAQPQDDGEQKPADAPAASEPAPAADEPATDEKQDDGAAPDNKPPQQSRDAGNLHGVELALADMNQDAPARPAEESKPASESAPIEPQADGQNPAATESQPAADGDKSAEPATEGAAPAEAQAAADAPAGDAASKYEPLEKVEPTIRSELGRQKAMKKMQEVLGQLREKMVKYGNERTRWELKHERDKTLRPPTQLDFDALAAEYHVTAHNTALVTALELRDSGGLGESFVGQGTPFLNHAFGQWQLYQAAMAVDSAGNQYLVWKTEQEAARVPELTEIRDNVVRAWKMIEARKPAAEHAKQLADQAGKEELSLADLAKRDELPAPVKPDPFSWQTYGTTLNMNNNIPPRLSAVSGIDEVGPDFMRAVFSLPVGGIGIAPDNPQTVFYVVELREYEPGLAMLQRGFLADDYRTYARVALPRQQQMVVSWSNNVKQEAGLKWMRQPDARRARAEGGEEEPDDSGAGD